MFFKIETFCLAPILGKDFQSIEVNEEKNLLPLEFMFLRDWKTSENPIITYMLMSI